MKGYLKIICANAAVSAACDKGAVLLRQLAAESITQEAASPYWKEPACSVLRWRFICGRVDTAPFLQMLEQLGGGQVSVCAEDSGIELACYQPFSSLLRNCDLLFAVCFLSEEE